MDEIPESLGTTDYHNLLSHICGCLEQKSDKSVLSLLSFVQNLVDFEHAVVSQFNNSTSKREISNVVNHSYDPNWIDVYLQEEYINVDPVISQGVNCHKPFVWSVEKNVSQHRHQFYNAAQDFGMNSGVAYVYEYTQQQQYDSRTIVSLTNVKTQQQVTAIYLLKMITPVLNEVMAIRNLSSRASLTEKETEVLRWMMEGKSAWETSVILAVSERTVRFHLSNIYKKLNVVNCAHAISVAIKLNLL